MIKEIKSSDNKLIKLVASLKKKNKRDKSGLFIAEGLRLCSESLALSSRLKYIIVSDSFFEKMPDFGNENFSSSENSGKTERDFNKYPKEGREIYKIPDALFAKISDTETPQGVMSVIEIDHPSNTVLSNNVLILDGVSEPGNMGTILRTADAMGFSDVFITKGSADCFSPKTVRSTMGSIFRLNLHNTDGTNFLDKLKDDGYFIVSAALSNSVPLNEVSPKTKNAIVIGNEAKGISKEFLSLSHKCARIEMKGNAESLNAAVAAGIMMYKFSQRGI